MPTKQPQIVNDPPAVRESYRRLNILLHQLRLQVHDLEEIVGDFEQVQGGKDEKSDDVPF